MNPYEQHRQNQFNAPLNEMSSVDACPTWHPVDSSVVISESSARAIVAAIDNNRPHKAALLIKALPWFGSILSGVRNTRHLDPVSYIALSDRSEQLSPSPTDNNHAKVPSRKDAEAKTRRWLNPDYWPPNVYF